MRSALFSNASRAEMVREVHRIPCISGTKDSGLTRLRTGDSKVTGEADQLYCRPRAIEGAKRAGIEVSTHHHEPARPHVHYPSPLVFLRRELSIPSPQRMFRLRVSCHGRICDTSVTLNVPEHVEWIFDGPLTSPEMTSG